MVDLIPKIIHHIAPADESQWHPMWSSCLESWKNNFPEPEYRHMMWNDEEDIDRLAEEFPEYSTFYKNIPFHIMKIDFIRYLILLKYGGTYTDMDMYCYKNFYNFIESEVALTKQSITPNEFVIGLICSTPNHPFFRFLVNDIISNFYMYSDDQPLYNKFYILDTVSYYAMGRAYIKYKDRKSIQQLDWETYCHPNQLYYNENMITRHMATTLWGKDYTRNLTQDQIKDYYWNIKQVNVDNWDYYTNYWRE